MKISWVLSDSATLDPTQDIDQLKSIGAFWGSWRTWRAYQTDNVICHDQAKSVELIKRRFETYCNFFIPETVYNSLDRPQNVKIYAGEFVHDIDRQEEIVALHLAATTSDIVLLLGYDLTKLQLDPDKLTANRQQNYRNLVRQALSDYNNVQWVLVDHAGDLDPILKSLGNLTTDTMSTILNMM
jgi:hypothetical protein